MNGVSDFNLGDALTVVAAMAYAGHVLAIDRYAARRKDDPVVLTFHQFWMVGVASLVAAALVGRPLEAPPRAQGSPSASSLSSLPCLRSSS